MREDGTVKHDGRCGLASRLALRHIQWIAQGIGCAEVGDRMGDGVRIVETFAFDEKLCGRRRTLILMQEAPALFRGERSRHTAQRDGYELLRVENIQAQCTVAARCGEATAIRAEDQIVDVIGMSVEGQQLLARSDGPHLDRSVSTTRGKQRTVGAEHRGTNGITVPSQRLKDAPGAGIPDYRFPVPAACR